MTDLDPVFAQNPEPRCACVLLLDTSYSMEGSPIKELNEGLHSFKAEVSTDSLASKRVEVSVVTFGGQVNVLNDFTTMDEFSPPDLTASGDTPMGQAISIALDMIDKRKSDYKNNDMQYYRPWVFMITDGAPTDDWSHAASRVRQEEDDKRMIFFAVGVENADMNTLSQIAKRTPLKLKGLAFKELFLWLSKSMQAISHSKTDEMVALPPPDWYEI